MDLVKELETQKMTARDFVVYTKSLQAQVKPEGIGVDCEGVGFLIPTEYAHQQISQKCGIPQKYYDHINNTNPPLLADMINNDISRDVEKRLMRTMTVNGQPRLRALLSDRFKVIDNYDVLFEVLNAVKGTGAVIHRCDLSDTHMYIRILSPKKHEVSVGDEVQRGVVIKNSEVGAGRFAVEPFVMRLVCSNGMIGESVLDRVHLGRKMDAGEIFSQTTRDLENETLLSQVGDIVKATFSDDLAFDSWLQQMRLAKTVEIVKPVEVTNKMAKKYKLSDELKIEILNEFMIDTIAGSNLWGLVNGITAVAKNQPIEERAKLERVAYDVLHDTRICESMEVKA
jgi:hypothetical protein